ncbi:MAG: geranylgeranyl reductase family protein [Methanobacteriota archaeon]|nr:MAG: geranylgeranyl reductase family protein [Euryarchaeota archaeon]
MMHDIIVVGAGPAGSYAAYKCASYGLDTLLVERTRLPRAKACGGAIGTDTVSHLGKDVMDVVERLGYENRLYFDYKLINVLKKPKFFVRRRAFDYYITQMAEGAGFKVEDGKSVKAVVIKKDGVEVRTKEATNKSRIVIGGDGMPSTVGKSVGLMQDNDRVYLAFRSQIDLPDSEIDTLLEIEGEANNNTYFFSDFLGFCWLIPNRNSINVGIGALIRKSNKIREKVTEFVRHFNLEENAPIKGHLIPYRPLDKIYSERVCLVGDAGGFVNPWNGCGIDLGIESSEKAAETCKLAVEENDFSESSLSRYQKSLNKQLRSLRFRSGILGLLDDLTPTDFSMPPIGESFVRQLSKLA